MVKPRWRSRSNVGSASFSAGTPRVFRQKSSPSVHWLKTKRISNADGRAASIFSISRAPKPWPMSEV